MITKNGVQRCDICGRFMKWVEEYYEWTPYGGVLDVEPPSPLHAHVKCYESQTDEEKELKHDTSWLKPHRYIGYEEVC